MCVETDGFSTLDILVQDIDCRCRFRRIIEKLPRRCSKSRVFYLSAHGRTIKVFTIITIKQESNRGSRMTGAALP